MRIAVDAMGGDHAPARPVDGALAAARHLGLGVDLVGRTELIRAELVRHPDAAALDVRVVDAPDAIDMAESPARGCAGLGIVGHGRSSVKAVRSAVPMASRTAENHMVERLRIEMAAFAVTS